MLPTGRTTAAPAEGQGVVVLSGRGLDPLLTLRHHRYPDGWSGRSVRRDSSRILLVLPSRGGIGFEVEGQAHTLRPGQSLRIPPGAAYRTRHARPHDACWTLAMSAPMAGAMGTPMATPMAASTSESMPAPALTAASTSESMAALTAATAPTALERAAVLLASAPGPLLRRTSREADAALGRLRVPRQPVHWLAEGLWEHTLATLVLLLAREHATALPIPLREPHPAVTRVIGWIEDHLEEPVDVARLTRISALSTSRFYDLFTTQVGTSPKDYVLRRKTELARDWLLADPAVTVTEVAHALSFSTSQHFATVFRRYQGTSPSGARRSPSGTHVRLREAQLDGSAGGEAEQRETPVRRPIRPGGSPSRTGFSVRTSGC
ncbi:AraC family transcriptional regulator [Streptomyces exfoliatus]|uniref:AraC family transcriptional regulator n=1 Tax=Streptomyces exfoliatus TaxID=1905 RepID=UPI000463C8A1|nr:AraC family transcriptional regulator [Streptomyces exfoliatus]